MLRHLLKLVWHRKRSNFLLMAEIFLAFLVVFAVVASGLFYLQRSRLPMGFDVEDVWIVQASGPSGFNEEAWEQGEADTFRRLTEEVRRLPEVEFAAMTSSRPYGNSVSVTGFERDEVQFYSHVSRASDDLLDVMGCDLVEGRWFEPTDSALEWTPIVVNQALATDAFGEGVSPLGQRLDDPDPDADPSSTRDYRIVGVISDYRYTGEFSEPVNFFFRRIDDREPEFGLANIAVRVASGTTAAFEEPLQSRLEAIAPGWVFRITTLATAKKSYRRTVLVPVMMAAVVAGFLLLMVVLGLTGVLWQNVTRRTRELGLRRALGATRSQVHRQIVIEVMLTAAFGLGLGLLVAIQVPLIGPLSFLPLSVLVPAMAFSAVVMAAIAGVCGLYPGWSATRIGPADALHHE